METKKTSLALAAHCEQWRPQQEYLFDQTPSGPCTFMKLRTSGELILGGVDPNYTDFDFITLPLYKNALHPWSVSVDWLGLGDSREEFDDCLMTFSTAIPWIKLPETWSDKIKGMIGAAKHDSAFLSFACEKRDRLPNSIFGVGKNEIKLTAYEYNFEEVSGADEVTCLVVFEESYKGLMTLGWLFLQNFVSVFAQDAREIRLAMLESKA